MPVPRRPRATARPETWPTARGIASLTACAVMVVLAAFLWPARLGGCTSFALVPASAAGGGLAAGDVVVTRCSAPGVGDRVVHRASGAVWAVGRVVGGDLQRWHVSSTDGVASTVPLHDDLLDVLPLQVSVRDAVLPAVAGALAVAAVGSVVVRRR